jgi:putative restriction endonuclease
MSSYYPKRDRRADSENMPLVSFLICFRLRMPPDSASLGTDWRAMDPPSHDTQLRQAFSYVDRLAILRGGVLDSADLALGFEFGGQRIPLINPQRGIFKPRQMEHLLSISGMTISARLIARSTRVMMSSTTHSWAPTRTRRITAGSWMRCSSRSPVIYFLGTSPGRYQPIIPTFIVGWHPERLRVDLAFWVIIGASAQATLPAPPERRYALREIKARLHTKRRFAMPS